MQTLIEASKAKYVLLCLLVYLVTLIGVRKDELRLEDWLWSGEAKKHE